MGLDAMSCGISNAGIYDISPKLSQLFSTELTSPLLSLSVPSSVDRFPTRFAQRPVDLVCTQSDVLHLFPAHRNVLGHQAPNFPFYAWPPLDVAVSLEETSEPLSAGLIFLAYAIDFLVSG
jgi:hypothetical protein